MAKKPFEDDGRTIADMSGVDYPSLFGLFRRRPKRGEKKEGVPEEQLTKAQTRRYVFGAVLAGLAVAGVFILAGALFIAFLLGVWSH